MKTRGGAVSTDSNNDCLLIITKTEHNHNVLKTKLQQFEDVICREHFVKIRVKTKIGPICIYVDTCCLFVCWFYKRFNLFSPECEYLCSKE